MKMTESKGSSTIKMINPVVIVEARRCLPRHRCRTAQVQRVEDHHQQHGQEQRQQERRHDAKEEEPDHQDDGDQHEERNHAGT